MHLTIHHYVEQDSVEDRHTSIADARLLLQQCTAVLGWIDRTLPRVELPLANGQHSDTLPLEDFQHIDLSYIWRSDDGGYASTGSANRRMLEVEHVVRLHSVIPHVSSRHLRGPCLY